MNLFWRLVFCILLLVLLSSCQIVGWTYSFDFGEPTHAAIAKDLEASGKYREAITEYEKHIDDRTKDPRRPVDENPNFYLILIGDCWLNLHEPAEAEKSYQEALEKGAEKELIVDRLKSLARWYAKESQFDKALALLNRFRELDSLSMDFEIDQIHRQSVKAEDPGNFEEHDY